MDYKQHIERNPEIMLGKPVIKGTRITVEHILRKLAGGYSIQELEKNIPHLTKDQILAALEYAADIIANEETTNRKAGLAKGLIEMSDDFDEPLDDFNDYR